MDLKSRVWKILHDSKYKEYYLRTQIEVFQSFTNIINSAIALITAASVISWILLVDYFYLWAFALIFTQTINIFKPTFPFSKFLKECEGKLKNIKKLNLEMDLLWLEIKNENPQIPILEERCLSLKKQIDTIAIFEDKTPFKFKKKTAAIVKKKMIHFMNA